MGEVDSGKLDIQAPVPAETETLEHCTETAETGTEAQFVNAEALELTEILQGLSFWLVLMVNETVACLVDVVLGFDEVNDRVAGLAETLMTETPSSAMVEPIVKNATPRSRFQWLKRNIRD